MRDSRKAPSLRAEHPRVRPKGRALFLFLLLPIARKFTSRRPSPERLEPGYFSTARPRNAEQRLLVALRVPFCDALGSDPLALSRLSSATAPYWGDSAYSIKNAGRSTLRSAFHQSFANSA